VINAGRTLREAGGEKANEDKAPERVDPACIQPPAEDPLQEKDKKSEEGSLPGSLQKP
jgi:hypothetical protein